MHKVYPYDQAMKIETLLGENFLKKKSLNDKEKDNVFVTEECHMDEIKQAPCKFVGLLFSANWCPPCKCFLDILKEFYFDANID